MLHPRSSRTKQDGIKRCDEGGGRVPDALPRRASPTYSRPTVSVVPSTAFALDAAGLRAGLVRCRIVVERHAAYLTRLDAVLGDGDHGDNLVIGFRAVDDLLVDLPDETSPGELLRAVGHRLVAAVGGASGPLYGTAFLEAGAEAGDRTTLDAPAIAAMLTAAADGLARRGRCAVGDKTILDALRPAATTFAATHAIGPAVRAAAAGARSTRGLVARRGLALRLGERSVGHVDPGAASCVLLLRALSGG